MEQQNSSKPVKKLRVGTITSAVFKNEAEVNGQTVVRYSAQIQKQYRKNDGTWHTTNSFFQQDLPKLQLVAAKTFEFLALKESADIEESVPI
jgi:hypothetical protein